MNDDLKERLTDLAFELKKHHRRYRSSFRNVIIFYIFIIIFVLIYTTIIGYKIQELAEPRTAAALIGSKVIVTPEYGRDLDPAAELLAESFMQILPMAFQYLGDSVRGEIDASANDLCTKVEEQYLPVLNNALSETIRLKNDGGNFAAVGRDVKARNVRADVDYLYVCRGFNGNLSHLARLFRPRCVVLDASLWASDRERCLQECCLQLSTLLEAMP